MRFEITLQYTQIKRNGLSPFYSWSHVASFAFSFNALLIAAKLYKVYQLSNFLPIFCFFLFHTHYDLSETICVNACKDREFFRYLQVFPIFFAYLPNNLYLSLEHRHDVRVRDTEGSGTSVSLSMCQLASIDEENL